MVEIVRRSAGTLFLTCLVACGGGAEEAIKDFEALNQEACACKDKSCADAAFAKLSGLFDKHTNARTSRESDAETLAYWFKGATACMIEQGVDRLQILNLLAELE